MRRIVGPFYLVGAGTVKTKRFNPRDLGCRCDECPLGQFHRSHNVFLPVAPEGPENARYVLIGEEPGGNEVQLQRPFIGPSGMLLDRTLNRLGLYREEVYLDNAILCRPPKQDLDAFNASFVAEKNAKVKELNKGLAAKDRIPRVATPQEYCRPHIDRVVERTVQSGGVVFTLGKLAYWSVLGKKPKISSVRGSFAEFARAGIDKYGRPLFLGVEEENRAIFGADPKLRLCATINPAFALKDGNAAYVDVLHRDLERGIRWDRGALLWEDPWPKRARSIHPDPRDLADWLRRPGWYAWDIESAPGYPEEPGRKDLEDHVQDSRENKLRVIGIYDMTRKEGVVIPWISVDGTKGFAPGRSRLFDWPTRAPSWAPLRGAVEPPSRSLAAPGIPDQTEAVRRGLDPWWKFDSFSDFHYDEQGGDIIVGATREWFCSTRHAKVGHFSNYFDLGTMLRHIGPMQVAAMVDQILLARLWNSELPRSLYFVGTMLTDVPAWKAAKDDRSVARQPRSQEELSRYNLTDTVVTAETARVLYQEAQTSPQIADLDHKVQRVCLEMHQVGLWIHEETRAEVEQETRDKIREEWDTISRVAGPDFNPRSTKQLGELLYETWKYAVPAFTNTGKPSTNEDAIRKLLTTPDLLDQDHRLMLEALWRSRGLQKDLSDVLLPMRRRSFGGIVHEDGVLRPDYTAHVPATGRISAGGPNCFDGTTEILTEDGWVRFDALRRGVMVAQFEPRTQAIDFVVPERYVEAPFSGEMIHIRSPRVDLFVTPAHRCLLQNKNGEWGDHFAEDYPEDHKQYHAGRTPVPWLYQDAEALPYSWTTNRIRERVPWSGTVYCVGVPSSYIIVRRNGKVAITGQTQNWRKRLRRIVRPRPGHLFLMADYDQIELRMMSAVAQVASYLKAFASGEDPHAVTALLIYGEAFQAEMDVYKKTGTKTERFTALRRFAKTFVYAVLYGGTAMTVYENVAKATDDDGNLLFPDMGLKRVEDAVASWMRRAAEIPRWWAKTLRDCEVNGYVTEPILGRKRHMPRFLRNESLNHPIQGAAAIVMGLGLVALREAFPPDEIEGLGIVNQMHDAVTVEVPESRAVELAEVVTKTLTMEFPDKLPGMVFTATADPAIDWSEKAWRAPGAKWDKATAKIRRIVGELRTDTGRARAAGILEDLAVLRADRIDDQFTLHKLEGRLISAMKADGMKV